MVSPEQLTAALARLDPQDREVLDFSLHRRVPDEDLARLYGGDTGDVARRRAAAVERLANDLGVKRGEDLGAVLKALLEPDTWKRPAKAPPPPAAVREPEQEPVLEMLGHEPEPSRPHRSASRRRTAAGVLAGIALLGGAVAVGAAALDGDAGGGKQSSSAIAFEPEAAGPLAAPFASDPRSAAGYLTARVRRPVALYDRPGGRRVVTVAPRTQWRTPRIFGVVEERGGWLGVQAPELRNGDIGWIRRSRATLGSVNYSVHADLSKRVVEVRRDGRTMRRLRVAIGSRRHPTPTGRFAVTDKLRVKDKDSPYGCCVLALTGHQTKLPADWPGGDRLAVHATTDVGSIGKRVSLGCMRSRASEARWLIENVPVGSPVFIRS